MAPASIWAGVPFTPNDLPPQPVLQTQQPDVGGLVPDAPTQGMMPPVFAPTPQAAADPTQSREGFLQKRLQQNQWKDLNPWGTAENHPGVGGKIAHVLSVAGNIAGNIFAPGVMASIPGTSLGRQAQEGEDSNELGAIAGEKSKNAATDANTAQTQAETAAQPIKNAEASAHTREANARANELTTRGDAEQPVSITPEQAAAAGYPALAGTSLPPKALATLLSGKTTADARVAVGQGHDDTRMQATQATNDTRESIATAANKTRTLVAQMHDNTSRANNANTNNHKGMAGGTDGAGHKVPADVTKRAALASNVNENMDAATKLLDSHPEIVGASGGRYSNIQQMIGSDDPNIQELGVRMHNIALASNGMHGLRSAEAVKQTEDELFNHFKAGPNAIRGAFKGTRDSAQTFLDDEKNFSTTGKREGSGDKPSGGTVIEYVRDPTTKKLVQKTVQK